MARGRGRACTMIEHSKPSPALRLDLSQREKC
jgi:hypothetical protein